jgi:gluconokinase
MPAIASPGSAATHVLAIDVGSSSVRALLYDGVGRQVVGSETQMEYRQRITADGGSESDPAELLELTLRCIDGVVGWSTANDKPISAVGATSFWHGMMGIDASNRPTTPVYMWSDKRSGPDAAELAAKIDATATHQATGCRIHSSYWPAKLRWLRRTDPDIFKRTARWVSITDFVYRELFGTLGTSVSMASGTGLMNAVTLDWDPGMMEATGLDSGKLPPIVDRTEPYSGLADAYARRWPGLGAIPWYPAIGDGAAANVGAACVGRSRIAMTIGTSAAMRIVVPDEPDRADNPYLPPRIWSYRLDRERRVLGGALSNGGNVTGWLADHLADGDFDGLTAVAAGIEPDGHGLTVLPFLAGERSPSWNDNATGTISGIRLATTGGDLFRATLEATAYRLAAIYDDLKPLATPSHHILANGAAALGSPLWLQIIADVLAHGIEALDAEAEASARGAAICALDALGVIDSLDELVSAVSRQYEPDPGHHQRYVAARKRQAEYEHAIETLTRT